MDLMREETFGPIVSVMRVADEEEAIRLANDSKYGLSGSVWTKNIQKGIEIAKRLETGSVVINDASMAYGAPEAPFGGMKDSGVGQVNGLGGLRGYTHQQPILIDRWTVKKGACVVPAYAETVEEIDGMIRFIYGARSRSSASFRSPVIPYSGSVMTRARDSVMPLVRNGVDKAANRFSRVGYGVLPWLIQSWRRVTSSTTSPIGTPASVPTCWTSTARGTRSGSCRRSSTSMAAPSR